MAKTGLAADRVAELKRELDRVVRRIVQGSEEDEDEEFGVDVVIDHAKEILMGLRELMMVGGKKSVGSLRSLNCPEEFRCPISKEVMRDPVIVSTGQTYDRFSIQKWLKAGNRTCPLTRQVLSNMVLTPNFLVREMIAKWCRTRGIELSDRVHCIDENSEFAAERERFHNLLEKMDSSVTEQKEAAKELRSLTKRMPSFRALFGESPEAIPRLLNPLCANGSHSQPPLNLQEDVITTLLNLSIHDNNKKLVAETPSVIPLLMGALKSGTIETRSNAAATLFTLSALDSNKSLIGQSGALKPLIDLLDEGHQQAMTDATSAIFNLCIIHENRARAVRDGAIGVILKKITSSVCLDELLATLALLSSHQKAVEEMKELGAVPWLLVVMRETSCERNKENCIAILHTICFTDRTQLKELRDEESLYGTISDLARNGTSRAKRKAAGILERLNRGTILTHTA
ncbi:hypothetical protein MLD38_021723 [Melastoma candidum]|uniref:Uncharacterized protein n=1 Tax=Melastoma candidum TaxID=119954 RepID=A0ACB9QKD7_9MYRT|nr:hypothetical protein MLD38_021723 [Melastoma candidum]